jgi:DNA-binding transcriptional MerR regulator
MAKSAQAFRTIREVADWLGIAAHVLRFWESKFSQIKPVKRAGGRRYYRPSDMELVGGIKVLLHDRGMTIRGVKKMITDEGLDAITALSPSIDGIADDAEMIDVTPDQEWEQDAASEDDAPVEDTPSEEPAPVDATPAPATPVTDPAPTAPVEAETTPAPTQEDTPAPSPPATPHREGGALGQLAHLAESREAIAAHLPALKALRDRMAKTTPDQ